MDRVGHETKFITPKRPTGPPAPEEIINLIIVGPDADAVDAAASELGLRVAHVATHGRPRARAGPRGVGDRPPVRRHVFVDNSNILIGAQCLLGAGGVADRSVRINVKALATLIEGDPHGPAGAAVVVQRVVAGSRPPKTDAVWELWRRAGYDVQLCQRNDETNEEEAVDAALQARGRPAFRGSP